MIVKPEEHLLANAMCRIDNSPNTLLVADVHKLLPWEQHTRHRTDAVDHSYEAISVFRLFMVRQNVKLSLGIALFELSYLGVKRRDDVRVAHGEVVHHSMHIRFWLLGSVAKVLKCALDSAICECGYPRCQIIFNLTVEIR